MRTAFALALALTACDGGNADPATVETSPPPIDLTDPTDRVSYAIGYDMGSSLKRQEIEVDLAALHAGMTAAVEGGEAELTEEEVETTLREFRAAQREKATEKRRVQGERNKEEGEAFLAQNAERPEVHVTESGLQYEVLAEGDGPTPGATDRVTVHYRGTLIDGTEFDSSYSRGEPASFRVNGVIRGWTEALQMMQVGDKYKLYIPSDLAYGPRGSGSKIGPNAVLIFEVELLGVE